MRKGKVRVRYSEEFRHAAVGRMMAGVSVQQLSRELQVCRSVLYEWRKKAQEGERFEREEKRKDREIAILRWQIRELEATVGRKVQEVDFLGSALRRVGASKPRSGNAGTPTSEPRSADGWIRKAD